MMRAAVLAVLLVSAAVIGLDTPLVMADNHLPEGAFVTTWNVTASSYTISIPVEVHTGGTLTIDWGDGTAAVEVTTNGIHSYTYLASGEYQVSMTGDLSRIILGAPGGTPSKLASIYQWGDIEWSSMKDAFSYTSNMKYNASDVPNLSGVSSMENMFNLASKFDGDLSEWNVSAVTYMRGVFAQTLSFNGDVSTWNVSAVTDMKGMFFSASTFNGDISSWNVSAVTNMNGMFSGASTFNGDISSWNVSAVTDMNRMFSGASDFNGDISNWNVSAVTYMTGMFEGASDFTGDISNWNVSAVTGMNRMFSGASDFNGDISNWNVSAVTDMNNMFASASSFNQPLNDWNVSAVTDMGSMFSDTTAFERNLGKWYVVPADTVYNTSDETSLVITTIAAQNFFLNSNHTPNYGIGTGGNSTLFSMTGSNLVFKATPSAVTYTVNVTASGSNVFENGNNWRTLTVTVTGQDNHLPDITAGGSADVYEGSVGRLTGTASDPDTGDILTYQWTHNGTLSLGITIANNTALSTTFEVAGDVTTDTSVTFTLTVNDGTSLPVTNTVDVTVQDSSGAFIATWKTGAQQKRVTLFVSGTNPVIDWGDGSERTSSTDRVGHIYAKADQYRVIVDGSVSRLEFYGGTPNLLRYVDQWGDIEWSSILNMFRGASNMEYRATDTPDLSRVTTMESMFNQATSFNGDISNWNVSAVTNMRFTFAGASAFNGDISNWNVSAVTDMRYMFDGASMFDGDISNWNVSAVTDMNSMFNVASAFNGDISNWNVSAVTDMNSMFNYASMFDGDISNWNVSAVTDMSSMFNGATSFDQPLDRWNVSAVTDMNYMFNDASLFNQPLNDWDVSAVTDMHYMFNDVSLFNQPLNDWDVSAVTDMHNMFAAASDFGGDISSWNVSAVTDMTAMFQDASLFNQPLNDWNVSAVTDMTAMFQDASKFNQPLNDWNVSAVTGMNFMFFHADDFEQNLGEWYILPAEAAYDITDASLNVTVISAQNFILDGHNPTYGIDPDDSHDSGLFNMTGSTLMFKATPSAEDYKVNVTASGSSVFERGNNWRTLIVAVTGQEDRPLLVDAGPDQRVLDESAVTLSGTVSDSDSTDLTYLWTQNSGSPAVALTGSDTPTPTFTAPDVSSDVDLIFTLRVSDGTDTDTDTVTVTVHDAEADFVTTWSDITAGTNFPIRNSTGSFTVDWGDGKISEYAARATDGSLVHLYDIPGTYTIRISGNFSGIYLQDNIATAGKLQSIDQWGDIKWTTMAGAFYFAINMIYNATDVPDLSSVTDMSNMFTNTGFSSGDLSGWDVSGVTDMRSMFLSSGYTGDLSDWDVSSVTDMQNMFSRTSSFDSDLSGWNVSAVTDMSGMFSRASSFDSDLSGWNVSSVTSTQNMFLDAAFFDSDLSDWNVSSVTDMRTMFTGATSFNSDLSGWNVSAVNNMDDMFSGATSFEQNLGKWYVVPADTDYDAANETTLVVTAIAAQNSFLNGHTHNYAIGTGGNSELFSMTGSNLVFKDTTPSAQVYKVNVTAPGGDFGTNNHHVFDITVTGEDNHQPDVTAGGSADVYEGSVGRLTGTASDPDTGDILTYQWTHNGTPSLGITIANNTALSTTFEVAGDVTTDTSVTFTLTVNDGTSLSVTKTVGVNIQDSSGAFIATWETGTPQMFVRFYVSGTNPVIDWGDGTERTVSDDWVSHTYAKAGQYRVIVDGSVSELYHPAGTGTPELLRYVDQWGDIEWSSMRDMFHGASHMEYRATYTPDLSGVSRMDSMFSGASSFDGEISSWNVSSVTHMSNMFFDASSFNRTLNDWNVSSVLRMSNMFTQASSFDQSLNNWDVSGVTSMFNMFTRASDFNGDISSWDVSSVKDTSFMFFGASSFNRTLNDWNVSDVTYMNSMFEDASDFNGDISGWNVSVTDMNSMFDGASSFNGDISRWNVSAVTDMRYMFSGASDFDGDISNWDVSAVTDMNFMFLDASKFNQSLNDWDVSAVTDMTAMFQDASKFNQPLNDWNVSAVTDMNFMFFHADDFEQNLGEWYILPAEAAYDITDASLNVTVISAQNSILDGHEPTYGIDPDDSHDSGLFNMTGNNLMFKSTPLSARVYTVNVTAPGGDFGTNNHHVFDITVTGEDRPLLVDAGPDQRVLDESAVTLSGTVSDSTDPTYLWTQNPGLPAVALTGSDTPTPTFTAPDVSSDVDLVFTLTVRDGTETVTDTVTVTVHNAEADFVITWGDTGTGINLPIRSSAGSFTVDWGDGKISESAAITTDRSLAHLYEIPGTYAIRISGNFSGISWQDNQSLARHLQSIDQWGDIEWTTMAGAFTSASNMIYNATDVPDLSSVTDMSHMFRSTDGFSSGDLSGWNVSGVTDMRNMFSSSSYTGDLSSWDVSSVTYMQNMFSRASSFNSDLSGWNVSAVNNMDGMFFRASSFNSDLSGWNVSSVASMQNMFLYASSFNSDLSGWNVSAVLRMNDMFSGATSFEQNLGPWYIVLDSDTIFYPTQTLEIMAQNSFLGRQNPVYGLGVGGDFDLFVVDVDAGTLGLDPNSDPPPNGIYQVSVTSTGIFGTANHHTVSVRVNNADPAVTPPTFDSSELNTVTGVLTIVFSETIDAANVVPAKIHIRESGNYTDGITLSAGEFVTVANDTAISFILIASHLTTVTGLTTPELTIESGAVQDMFGNLIDGTFDVSTAVFVNATSVSSQDTKPYGIAFSNNGTKMFVVGDFENDINQYTLSIAFDVSTASHDGNDKRFSVSSQDTSPRGMAFSNDGTKMFVVGDTNNNINQYALSIPFDISTANFTTAISTPDNYPKGMAFSNDGTKMFVVSSVKSAINQYTLSIPFDLFNATFVASPFDISEQDTYPKDMAFSNDGTKMFVIGARANTINQYTLSAPFDLFNATYDGDGERFSVSSQDDDPAGMTFSNDGAKMFVVGDHGNDVNEYALSSVYPITVTNEAAIDTTAPVIELDGPATITITVGGTYNEQGAVCDDDVDLDKPATVGGQTVDVDAVGTYIITYDCTDTSNNAATQVTRTVTVEAAIDTTAPVIELDGPATITITVGGTYNEQGAVCDDDVDLDKPATVGGQTVDVDAVGTYIITYDCTDTSNNAATQVTRTVTVEAAIDTTAPVIELDGPATITITVGGTYNEQGAVCDDDVDLDKPATVGGQTVDVDAVGTYIITYDCTDTSNNAATQVTRTVTVTTAADTTAPVIELDGPATITITVGGTYNEQGAVCDDDVDLDKPATVGGQTVDVDAVGTYIITYDCTDTSNNAATQVTRTVTVTTAADTTAPVIELDGPATITITVGGTYNEQGAVCDDDVDLDKPATVGGQTVDVDAVGTYIITYDCTDTSNNAATQVTRTVTVEAAIDTTAPVIELDGPATITITVGGTYNEQGAVCDDDVDLDKPATVGGQTVDVDAVGTYIITYDCTDTSNNAATQVTRTVTVTTAADTTAPVIELDGPATITITVGGTYNEQGAVCDDDVDLDKPATVGGQTVDVDAVGTYIITYDCTDTSNNAATQVTRTVTVEAAIDTTAPVIELDGPATITITVGGTYNEQGAVCDDDVDLDKPATVGGQTVDVDAVGTYIITYDCTDTSNNAATQVTRTVTVEAAIDTTAPVIELDGPATITITVGGTYNEQGAVCDDDVDLDKPATVGGQTVDVDAVGTYIITYDCTDTSNNAATQVTRTVTVTTAADTTAPVIELDGPATITITVGGTYNEQGAVCDDDVDLDKPATVGGQTVDVDAVGTYIITYDCTDTSNNAATQVTRTVTVTTAADTTAPVIELDGPATITITVGGTYNEQGAVCDDDVDLDKPATVGGQTVDVDAVGTYIITYDCTDTSNNAATQVTRTVTVTTAADNTSPVIELDGPATITITVGGTYNEQGAVCDDDVDLDKPATVGGQTVDVDAVGTYIITYDCTDTSNNAATQVTRTVTVTTAADNTSPVIELDGPATITITVGGTYNEQGAVCGDDVDLDKPATVGGQTVDTGTAGTYVITYDCTDTSNNSAIQVTRTVTVQSGPVIDTTPPVITLIGSDTATVTVDTSYNDAGATCRDDVDGSITPTFFSTVDISQTGTYSVTYSCTDDAGNDAVDVSRTVLVQSDTTPPRISLTGYNPARVTVDTSYNDAGATCRDDVDGSITPTSFSTVDISQTGTYSVTYSCTDDAGNDAVDVSRTVLVHEVGEYQRSSSRSVPLTTDSSMTINGQSYQLGSGTVTIEPYTVTTGHDTDIEFIAYSTEDIIHFTVYLDLHDNDVGYSDRGTYVRYDQGTVKTNDPNGFISYASITITEDEEDSDKKIISVVIEFDGAMGLTNMVVYMWNEDRGSSFIRIFDALDVTAESEPVEPEPRQEPLAPDFADDATDPEPVSSDTPGPADDYDDAQVLMSIRMWSGFESEMITDTQLLELLGLEGYYQGVDLPDWMMTQLGVLVVNGDVTVEEFVLALQYVLENL